MRYVSVGDMAQHFLLRRQNTNLKNDLNRLSLELSSGQKTNLPRSVAGDFSPLAAIDHSLSNLTSYKTATDEAAQFAQATQDSLDMLQTLANSATPALLAAGNSGHDTLILSAATDTAEKFKTAISTMNIQIAGRSIFAGDATDQTALVTPETIISNLQAAISGQTTAAGVQSTVDAWFDTPGGGFDTLAFQGSTTPLAPFQIGRGQQATVSVSATDPAIRDTLKGLAIAALVGRGALAGNTEQRRILLRSAGESLLSSQTSISQLRASVGSALARIEDIATQHRAESVTLTIAKSNIVSADPYKTASDLKAVQSNLEILYTLTARISRLSLVNYLK